MKHLASFLSFAASAALLYPLSFMPDALEKCADDSWQFQTMEGRADQVDAAAAARSEFCRVAKDNAARL